MDNQARENLREYDDRVLANFVSADDRLLSIPAQRKKTERPAVRWP